MKWVHVVSIIPKIALDVVVDIVVVVDVVVDIVVVAVVVVVVVASSLLSIKTIIFSELFFVVLQN